MPAASRRSIIAFWLVLGLARQTFAQDLCLVPTRSAATLRVALRADRRAADGAVRRDHRDQAHVRRQRGDDELRVLGPGRDHVTATARSRRRTRRDATDGNVDAAAAAWTSTAPTSRCSARTPNTTRTPRRSASRAPASICRSAPRAARPSSIEISSDSRVSLANVLFTTCPPDNVAWELQRARHRPRRQRRRRHGARRQARLQGRADSVRAVLHLPDQRRAQERLPDARTSASRDRTGFDLTVPYYLNLAPNYDLTLEPRYMSERGMQVRSDFRYLHAEQPRRVRLRVPAGRQRDDNDAPLREPPARVAVRRARSIGRCSPASRKSRTTRTSRTSAAA